MTFLDPSSDDDTISPIASVDTLSNTDTLSGFDGSDTLYGDAAEDILSTRRLQRSRSGDLRTQAESLVRQRRQPQFEGDDEAFAAFFVGQPSLGPPGAGIITRANLSILGDNPEERQRAFTKLFPDGEILSVPGTDIVLFRENPSQLYSKVDADAFELLFRPGGAREFIADIVDFADEALTVGGELVSLVGRRPRGAPNGPTRVGDITRVTLGAAGAEAAQQGVQALRGTQLDTLDEARARAIGEGAFSLLGGTVGALAGDALNAGLQRGVLNLTDQARRARDAALRLGTKPLTAGQLSDIGFVRALSKQAQNFVPRLTRYINEQSERTALAVRSVADRAALSKVGERLSQAVDDGANIILNMVRASVGAQRGINEGQVLQDAVTQWWDTSRRDIDVLYANARSIAEPQFDLTSAQAVAQNILDGVQARRPDIIEYVDAAGNVSPVRTSASDTRRVTPGGSERIGALDARIKAMAEQILRLDPSPGPVNTSVIDQLRALRQELDDLSIAGPEGTRLNPQGLAARLRGAIQDTIDNPVNPDPDFRRAWQRATAAARTRFETREKIAVLDLVRSETPFVLGQRLTHPDRFDDILAIREATDKRSFDQFRAGFKFRLTDKPFELSRRLDEFDTPAGRQTLGLLLSKTEQEALRLAADNLDRLANTNVRETISKQSEIGSIIGDLVSTNDTGRIADLRRLIDGAGGLESPVGKSVRAGIIDQIWRMSYTFEKGIRKFSSTQLNNTLDRFRENGVLRLLTKGELRVLRDARLVEDFASRTADAGTALQTASAARGLLDLSGQAIGTLLENITLGRILGNERLVRIFTGTSAIKPLDTIGLRVLGASLGTIATDAEASANVGNRAEDLVINAITSPLRRLGFSATDLEEAEARRRDQLGVDLTIPSGTQ